MKRIPRQFLLVAISLLLLAACDASTSREQTDAPTSAAATATPPSLPEGTFTPNPRRADDNSYYVNKLLPFDGIRPIYNSEFARAEEVELVDEALVMGVAFDGEAKAYPVSVLRFREMVNDELRGIPILASEGDALAGGGDGEAIGEGVALRGVRVPQGVGVVEVVEADLG